MERTQNTGNTSVTIDHDFTLKEKSDTTTMGSPYNILIGYAVKNPQAKYQPAWNVVQVTPTGETEQTGFVIDANKAGDLVLKLINPDYNKETPVEGTYAYNIFGKLFDAIGKGSKTAYHRASNKKVGESGRRMVALFKNDRGTGTAGLRKQA